MKVGIIAGSGDLPEQLAAAVAADGFEPVILKLNEDYSVGQAGAIMEFFKLRGVKVLVMVGGLRRPEWARLKMDWKGFSIVSKILFAQLTSFVGDDRLLKTVRKALEGEGFELRGVQHYMPDLLCPEGVLGRVMPSEFHAESIRTGFEAAKSHGEEDLGQSVVVLNGDVIAMETRAGTDALIRSVADVVGDKILVKVSKPQQDRDFDLPTVGIRTVEEAVRAGFKGIAVESVSTLIPNRDDVVRECDRAGLFFVGVSEDDF